MIDNKIIICDLDGCLIDSAWIWEVIKLQKFEKNIVFDFFNRNANAEANNIDLVLYKYLCFKASGGYKIHFLTARSEEIEIQTINFIQEKTGLLFGKEFTISFRPFNDFSSAAESKKIRLEQMIANGKNIILAIDDDEEIIDMYKTKGIPTLQWKIGYIPACVALEFGGNLSLLINKNEPVSLN
ncbi:TPA: hypothetical protein IAA87_05790 [Candidatus Avigastranaerophilus faecigallinarum]|nr:hypothetical protein [Candidatus Avigastranaerophilus faecigallinarum]